jgi:hypothetical protein
MIFPYRGTRRECSTESNNERLSIVFQLNVEQDLWATTEKQISMSIRFFTFKFDED